MRYGSKKAFVDITDGDVAFRDNVWLHNSCAYDVQNEEKSTAYRKIRETWLHYLNSILENDVMCVSELRMDLRMFGILCELLHANGRVKNDGLVTLEEQTSRKVRAMLRVLKLRRQRKSTASNASPATNTVLPWLPPNQLVGNKLKPGLCLCEPNPLNEGGGAKTETKEAV
ncbi:NB-ARC domain-containing disease resistance protein [Prunus dulcis]|uniref:NB-ARC domain-containing disease resistance protein n=1 Tax=Prunus dulcis TaxID=3755 RepID=A0A4Y1RM33_PRUDU|nr:NB-ARC domain-containing disease resistance protein [Prunus dulcis]